MQATAERPPPPAATRARIVLVEDDRNSGEAICELLGFLGYDCRWLGTADAAFALLTNAEEGERDVLMLDLALRHGEDGVGLVRRLRASGARVPPILIFSARPAATLREAMRETGACGVLGKPAGVDAMCRAIDAAKASRSEPH